MKKLLVLLLGSMLVIGSTFAFAEDVYVTKNGKKYHKVDCLLIKNKGAKAIALEEAQKKGLKPCRRCFGETDSAKNSKNENVLAKASDNNSPADQATK